MSWRGDFFIFLVLAFSFALFGGSGWGLCSLCCVFFSLAFSFVPVLRAHVCSLVSACLSLTFANEAMRGGRRARSSFFLEERVRVFRTRKKRARSGFVGVVFACGSFCCIDVA